ncbi:MAG: ATP-dependent DNA helicase [Halobacteriales archaeon]|nr:ATP-dependent DNA helicase [Halobacteriales archaeon]
MVQRAYFPYAPRPQQAELTELLARAVRSQAHVAVEAGTGMGKTVCALAATLPACASGARVLYLTRTHAQQHQVMKEFRRVRERSGLPLVGVALQGRRHLCLRMAEEPELAEADADEFGRMCLDRRKVAEANVLGSALPPELARVPACPWFEQGLRRGTLAVEDWARESAPFAEELAARAALEGMCPDHVVRNLLADADLVVAPYAYLLHPALRASLLRGMRCELAGMVVVVDEAHNLPDAARELWSRSLAVDSVTPAMQEAERLGDPVCQGLHASQLLRALRHAGSGLVAEYLVEDDGPVPEGELEARLLAELRCPSPRLTQALAGFAEHGERVREQKRREGKLPRSCLGGAVGFLQRWLLEDEGWVRLVEGSPARLTCALLDAPQATLPLLQARASLHLSGTLAPVEQYRASVGLPANTPIHRFPPPFDPARRLALHALDVSTRHEDVERDPTLLPRVEEAVRGLLALDRKTLVCFPSHALLARMSPGLPAMAAEEAGLAQTDLMRLVQRFRRGEVRALGAVMGGRLAEGMDFPAGEVELVVLIGLPYAKPSFRLRALIAHHEARGEPGWSHAVEAPALRRAAQAAGRLLRGPEDSGVLVVLDHRAPRLRTLLPDLRGSADPAGEAARFFACGATR